MVSFLENVNNVKVPTTAKKCNISNSAQHLESIPTGVRCIIII